MNLFRINFNKYYHYTIFNLKNNRLNVFCNNTKSYLSLIFNMNCRDIHFDNFTNTLTVKNIFCNSTFKEAINCLNLFLKKKYSFFFFKIKFTGKGYRIQSFKKKKTLNFTFGHSHCYFVNYKNIFLKRISKYKYFFETTDKYLYNTLQNQIRKIKPINKYTLRGVRLVKTKITKRKGRKSPNL